MFKVAGPYCFLHRVNPWRAQPPDRPAREKGQRNVEEAKMNKLFCFVMLVLATSPVLAAESQPVTETHYEYGMPLDIAEVISITSTDTEDTVYPATMEYIDAQGQAQRVTYIVSEMSWGSNQ